MAKDSGNPNCYDVLQVHPAAPLDLITAAYWRLVGQAQASRASDPDAEAGLHALTRAYEVLADPKSRATYDAAAGIPKHPVAPRLPGRGRRARVKEQGDTGVDYYELLRVVPTADRAVVEEAYGILRSYYLRLIHNGSERPDLIQYLYEAYAVIGNPERRRLYDQGRSKHDRRLRETGSVSSNGSAALEPPAEAVAEQAPPEPPLLLPDRPVTGTAAEVPVPMAEAGALAPEALPEPALPPPPADDPAAAGGAGSTWPALPWVPDAAETGAAEAPGREAGAGPPLGPIGAVAGGAGALVRSLGRQLSSMSRREAEQSEQLSSRQEQERQADLQMEDVLLQRLSASASTVQSSPAVGTGKPVARLDLVEGPGSGNSYDLESFPLTLGGDAGCDIELPGLVSHRARLLFRDGRFVVYNLAAVNSEDPDDAPWWILESGDDLRLGPYTLRLTTRAD